MLNIGDTILLKGTAFTVQDFPPKIGLPDGAAYEAVREMDADDEAKWEADSLAVLLRDFLNEHGRDPTDEDVAALEARAKLRPTLKVVQREAAQAAAAAKGEPLTPEELEALAVPRPRLKRLTGLVADLEKISEGLFQVKGA